MNMPTTLILACKVTGCGAVFEIPVVYRLERTDIEAPTFADPDRVIVDTRVAVDVEATVALEAYARGHLEMHALAETLLDHPDDPGRRETSPFDPRDEHLEVDHDDEPDGWRTP